MTSYRSVIVAIASFLIALGAGYLLVDHRWGHEPGVATPSVEYFSEEPPAEPRLSQVQTDGTRESIGSASVDAEGVGTGAAVDMGVREDAQQLVIRIVDPYGSLGRDGKFGVSLIGPDGDRVATDRSCFVGAAIEIDLPKSLVAVRVRAKGGNVCGPGDVRVGLPCHDTVEVPVVACASLDVIASPDHDMGTGGRVALIGFDDGSRFDAEMDGHVLPLDPGGRAQFRRVPPGRYRVEWHSNKTGATAERAVDVSPGANLTVEFGESLEYPCYLTGSFLLDGSSVDGARIWASSHRWSDIPAQVSASVDGEGDFSIELPMGGKYDIWVDCPYGRLYQETIELEGGFRELLVDMRAFSISGGVMDNEGVGVAGAEVSASSLDKQAPWLRGGLFATAVCDSSGHFKFTALPIGGYELAVGGTNRFRTGGAWNAYGRNSREVVLNSDLSVLLVVPPAEVIRGKLIGPGGSAVRGVVYIRPAANFGVWRRVGGAREDGAFSCGGVAPGEYLLFVSGEDALGLPAASVSTSISVEPGSGYNCGNVQLYVAHDLAVSVVNPKGISLPMKAGCYSLASGERLEMPASGFNSRFRYLQRLGPLPLGDYEVVGVTADGQRVAKQVTLDGGSRNLTLVLVR